MPTTPTPYSPAKLRANPKLSNTNGWQERHNNAVTEVIGREAPLVRMFQALNSYAYKHFDEYESLIGDDGVLGPAWTDMLRGLRTLLNGNIGRLDAGTMDAAILALAAEYGVNGEEL